MDATEFRRASRAVWEAMAPGWDERHTFFEKTAWPVTARMLERVAPKPGQEILDLAAGTGVVGLAAAALVAPGGRVIVSDFSQAMLEAAARHAAELRVENAEFRVLDAERLDLADRVVDGVVCRWGYMLMADPAAALAETRRVLCADGRLSCAVFAGAEGNPWAALPSHVLEEHGRRPPVEAGTPGILALSDRDRLRRLITGAGFENVVIDEVPFTWRFPGPDAYWRFLTGAAGAIAMVLGRLDEDERERVHAKVNERLAPYHRAGRIELPAVSLVATAS